MIHVGEKPFVSSCSDGGRREQDDVKTQLQMMNEKQPLLKKPMALGAMSKEELDAELQKGVKSILCGNVIAAEDVDAEYD